MFIYKIINTVNNKIYVGKTKTTLEKRFKTHLNNSKTRVSRLYSAIKCYGFENFKIEVIEEVFDSSTLNDREIFWINELNSQNQEIGYNMTPGGDGCLSEETRKIIGSKLKGRKLSDEHKSKISIGNKGKHSNKLSDIEKQIISDLTKKALSNPIVKNKIINANRKKAKRGTEHAMFGKKQTIETRKKMSNAKKGKHGTKYLV